MSMVTTRTVSTVRHEYIIPNDAPWSELGKAYAQARNDIEAAGKDPSYDDAAHVTSDGENIIIYWEETK